MQLVDTPACSDSPKEDPGSQLPLQIKIKVNGEVDVRAQLHLCIICCSMFVSPLGAHELLLQVVLVCIDLTDRAAFTSTQTVTEQGNVEIVGFNTVCADSL